MEHDVHVTEVSYENPVQIITLNPRPPSMDKISVSRRTSIRSERNPSQTISGKQEWGKPSNWWIKVHITVCTYKTSLANNEKHKFYWRQKVEFAFSSRCSSLFVSLYIPPPTFGQHSRRHRCLPCIYFSFCCRAISGTHYPKIYPRRHRRMGWQRWGGWDVDSKMAMDDDGEEIYSGEETRLA